MIKFNEQTGEIKVTNSTSSQTEISDEEIEAAAPLGNLTAELAFINGAKWYREQLKQL